ncbi:tyrosine-type recombinase/integrase [Thermococcus litoralis]|uniref:tyrosine-type recombinase/integrase n=1 Tax=Thermococcus litoralis TaxID=2265 RepID=UPI0014946645|nr:site-specific integrase [Thermococcus litoralis]
MLEEVLKAFYSGRRVILGPGPGFEPGLGDPQPSKLLNPKNDPKIGKNELYGHYIAFSRKLQNSNVTQEQSEEIKYFITQEHLNMLFLELKAKGVQEHHYKFVERSIKRFLDYITQEGNYYVFTLNDLISYLEKLQNEYHPVTYRKQLTYIKKLFRIAQIPLESYLKSKRIVGVDRTVVTVDDIKNLINIIKSLREKGRLAEKTADRMLVSLLLMATSGIRTHELIRLKLKNIDIRNRTIFIDENISKTNRARVTFFTKEVQKLLKRYVQKYNLKPEDNIVTYFALEKPFLKKNELKTQPIRPKHMRKFFSQEWDRKNGNSTVKKLLMGHSIREDINVLHYSHHTPEELKQLYDTVFGNLKFGV